MRSIFLSGRILSAIRNYTAVYLSNAIRLRHKDMSDKFESDISLQPNLVQTKPTDSTPTDVKSVNNDSDNSTQVTNQTSIKDTSLSDNQIIREIQRESPSKCIRVCLEECFDSETIIPFCQDYFVHVYKRLTASDQSLDKVIVKIITYCSQHGKFEYLWQKIKDERENHYQKYYLRWKKAVEAEPEIERLNTQKYDFSVLDDGKSELHGNIHNPLTQELNQLAAWFFKDLQLKEQCLLLAAALFEGMGRQKLVEVTADLEKLLSKDS